MIKIKNILKPALEILGLTSLQVVDRKRTKIASKYLKGTGVEVGALHRPLILNESFKSNVMYVDRLDTASIQQEYKELKDFNLVNVEVVDNGETLEKIADNSLEFIIANHFIEHTENPLGTIRNHLKKLHVGGILFYAVPNKNKTFDKGRNVTSWDHILSDDTKGPEATRYGHYSEWVYKVLEISNQDQALRTTETLINSNYSIHFHVWDKESLREFINKLEVLMNVRLLEFCPIRDEIIVVLRKI